MQVEPYLFFEGRTEEAIEFYQGALGAQVQMLMRFGDSPDPNSCPAGEKNMEKIMHASMKIGDTNVMMSDGNCESNQEFKGFALSISFPDEGGVARSFAALSQGGEVVMPLGETFFAKSFGMLKDRFGVHWMLITPK